MQENTQCIRTPWHRNFCAEVIIHTTLEERDINSDYNSAKAGDINAAMRLALYSLSNSLHIQSLQACIGKYQNVKLVPVTAIEALGRNCIPEAIATILSDQLAIEIATGIVQSNRVFHTRARAFFRIAHPALFSGDVEEGQHYLIVDDHVCLGGTIANLKGYIETNGGIVIGATTLTASHNSENLVPTEDNYGILNNIEGLNEYLIAEMGYYVENLTRAEAGQFIKAGSVDVIRNRIIENRPA